MSCIHVFLFFHGLKLQSNACISTESRERPLKLNITFNFLWGPSVIVAHKCFVIGRLINPGDNLPLSAALGTGHSWSGF